MQIDPMAGKLVPPSKLENIAKLISAYYTLKPNAKIKEQRVSFGTSGHRGNAYKRSFNQDHIKAITQAICDYRKSKKIDGPLFLGIDTHALSIPAQITAIEVFVANKVDILIAKDSAYTPTPLVSFAILEHNKNNKTTADGVIITPSHNPPSDGGYKYNPPTGGPASSDITKVIENRANEILENNLKDVQYIEYEKAIKSTYVQEYDYITPYVNALTQIIDIKAIKNSNLNIAVHPLGGASIDVYKKINEIYDLNLNIIHPYIDQTFSFMHLDHDGKIRMDCSSKYAMAGLVKLKDKYDLAFANDVDSDRHGIITPKGGLLNPNHYLSIAIWYLCHTRKNWKKDTKIGKTLVSSSMIDRVAISLEKEIYEVPVGFKWFSDGLYNKWLAFGGEESAGASFLRLNGDVWTTDKDGIILNLLSAEILATKKRDLADIYKEFEDIFGKSYYERVDIPTNQETKERIKSINPSELKIDTLGGEKIEDIYTKAPGNGESINGIKIVTKNGWVAIRPSGTEDIYKIYCESFLSKKHLKEIENEAQKLIDNILKDKK